MKAVNNFIILLFIVCTLGCNLVNALSAQTSESRQIQELDGFWNFRADYSLNRAAGFENKWHLKPLSETGPVISMPTWSSFNDITTDKSLQKFVGWVWYDKTFFVDSNWSEKRVVLRVESAHYNAVVWVNGNLCMTHSGGHLPFESEVKNLLKFNLINRVTIAINNTLTPNTLPTGFIQYPENAESYPPGYFVQNTRFDFFNYAGLHRQVRMYATPLKFIKDITIKTISITGSSAKIEYKVEVRDLGAILAEKQETLFMKQSPDNVFIQVLDKDGKVVAESSESSGTLGIQDHHLWWPYTMSDDFGYLYEFKVRYGKDVYRQLFGIRTVGVNNQSLLINNKPFYCLGVNKHEDSDLRGKGLDLPLIARDFNMLKWLGVNCFRTSHYPYAEEVLDRADQQGIVVIDECTAVGLKTKANYGDETLNHHLEVMKELVGRDKNHASVIMWSIANEPASDAAEADQYFKKVSELTRSLDPTRPVTLAISGILRNEQAAKYLDVLCINRYYGWYHDMGQLATIRYKLLPELEEWHKTFNKPLIISEYGADTIHGIHTIPSQAFSEEYQADFLSEYHKVFDEIRSSFLTGEMVWNFADFMTNEDVNRVVGNRKGLLTRQRQPKMSAHLVRQRYWMIINGTSTFL